MGPRPSHSANIEDIVRFLIRASGNTVKPVWIRIVLSFKHFPKFKHFPSSLRLLMYPVSVSICIFFFFPLFIFASR